jgi:ABC-type Na+ efflux pump permease subunit
MLLVLHRDYREMSTTPAFRIMIIAAGVITAAAVTIISIVLHRQQWYGAAEARPGLDIITGMVVYFLSLMVLMSFIWAFASFPVIKEKVNGNIECLLGTPLSPGELLAGKGLAVFIPGYVISSIALGIILAAINLIVYLPGWHVFVLPWPPIVLGLIIDPLLLLSILLLTLQISFIANPDGAIAPSMIAGFGLMIGMPVGLATGFFDINSWSFAVWYTIATTVAWIVVLAMNRTLTRQNIVLSDKGG